MSSKFHVKYLFGFIILIFVLYWIYFDIDRQAQDTSVVNTETKQNAGDESEKSTEREQPHNYPTATFADGSGANIVKIRNAQDLVSSTIPKEIEIIDNPESLVSDYISQIENSKLQRYQELWTRILGCPACLELIRQRIETNSIEDNPLLEFTHLLLEADHPIVTEMMENLLRPEREGLTQQLFIQQVIRKGEVNSYEKLLAVLQAYDNAGQRDFVLRQIDLLSGIMSPDTLQPTLDLALGRTNASPGLQARVGELMMTRMVSLPEDEEVTRRLIDYYYNASDVEANAVWDLISKHGSSLVTIAIEADQRGETDIVDKVFDSVQNLRGDTAVESIMALYNKVARPQQTFSDAIIDVVKRDASVDTLHRLENYLRGENVSRSIKLVAAEGLLAVKDNQQARYILEKMIQSNDYNDAEIVSYISGRM